MSDTLVKVANFEEIIDELEFALQDAKTIIKDFSNNKDFKENLEGLKDFNTKITELKLFLEDIKKIKSDTLVETTTLKAIITQISSEIENLRTEIEKLNNIKTTHLKGLKEKIIVDFECVIKNIETNLKIKIANTQKEMELLKDEIEETYKEDYFLDVTRIKSTQKFIIMLLFILLAAFVFFEWYSIKEINYLENVIYANYNVLHQNN